MQFSAISDCKHFYFDCCSAQEWIIFSRHHNKYLGAWNISISDINFIGRHKHIQFAFGFFRYIFEKIKKGKIWVFEHIQQRSTLDICIAHYNWVSSCEYYAKICFWQCLCNAYCNAYLVFYSIFDWSVGCLAKGQK